MEMLQIQQITRDDIREAVRQELNQFFSENQIIMPDFAKDDLGGMDLAIEITGLAKPTLYSLVSTRKIPHCKKGKKLYFSRNDLENWIANGKRKTQDEIAIEADNYEQNKSRVKTAINETSLSKP